MARIELPSAADQTALDGNIFATVESGKACIRHACYQERLAHSDGELLHAQARTPLEALCTREPFEWLDAFTTQPTSGSSLLSRI
jgi:hypothetical protein